MAVVQISVVSLARLVMAATESAKMPDDLRSAIHEAAKALSLAVVNPATPSQQ